MAETPTTNAIEFVAIEADHNRLLGEHVELFFCTSFAQVIIVYIYITNHNKKIWHEDCYDPALSSGMDSWICRIRLRLSRTVAKCGPAILGYLSRSWAHQNQCISRIFGHRKHQEFWLIFLALPSCKSNAAPALLSFLNHGLYLCRCLRLLLQTCCSRLGADQTISGFIWWIFNWTWWTCHV